MRRTAITVSLAVLTLAWSARADEFVVAPPASLQTVVDLAKINSDPFDVIFVNPGLYDESVTIDFTGSNQEGLAIVRNAKQRPTITGGVLVKDARLVTLGGFRVDSQHGDGVAAVRIRTSTGVAIVDCVGFVGDDGGVDADDTYEVIVEDCNFSDMTGGGAGYGVRIIGRCGHQVRKTIVDGNGHRGLWIEADRTVVRDCRAEGNGPNGAAGGMYVMGHQNEIRDCEVADNEGFGMVVAGTCRIRGNDVTGNDGVGIRYGDGLAQTSSGGEIRSNKVKKNGGFGIVVREDQNGCELKQNTVTENAGSGIRIQGDRHVVRANIVKKNKSGGHGVEVTTTSSGNCIEQNSFGGNTGEAVLVDGSDNLLINNGAKGNDGYVNSPGATGNDGHTNKTAGTNDFP